MKMADMEPDDAVISAGTDFDCLKIDFSTWLCFKAWQKKKIFSDRYSEPVEL